MAESDASTYDQFWVRIECTDDPFRRRVMYGRALIGEIEYADQRGKHWSFPGSRRARGYTRSIDAARALARRVRLGMEDTDG